MGFGDIGWKPIADRYFDANYEPEMAFRKLRGVHGFKKLGWGQFMKYWNQLKKGLS